MKSHITCFVYTVVLLLCFQISFAQSFSRPIRLKQASKALLATSLDFGPDERLYITDVTGDIHIYTIERKVDARGTSSYTVTDREVVKLVREIQNYNDDGTLHDVVTRQSTGILVVGTAQNPIIYVTSSDYRINEITNVHINLNLDSNSGTISRLTWNGSSWEKVDLVRGLPRSAENHATNGMFLDESSHTLYVAQGGNTNAGSPSFLFRKTTEYALSAAILTVNLKKINAMPVQVDPISGAKYIYDLPTLDDPTRQNKNGVDDPTAPKYDGIDINDPFGGNHGLNQAKLMKKSPVQIYSSGFRNPYDIIITDAGYMYSWDNGGNPYMGGGPIGEGIGTATNNFSSSNLGQDVSNEDGFHLIDAKGYYAGHPCPIRANPDSAGLYINTGKGAFLTEYNPEDSLLSLPYDWPPVQAELANPIEGVFYNPGRENDPAIYNHRESTNGLAEYKASNFNSAMKGDIIASGFSSKVHRVQLNSKGGVDSVSVLASFGTTLDVVCNSDDEPFPGTIWILVHSANTNEPIRILEPEDYKE